jgi:hypothetical protein
VFVQAGQFQDPIRPSTVIVNNATILERTKVFNNIARENREIAGVGRHKVVIYKGPGMEVVQKATGRRVNMVPIQEAARRAPMPARRTAVPERTPRNENLRNNPVPGNATEPTPRQETTPRRNERPLVQPTPTQPPKATPREQLPSREVQPHEKMSLPPQSEQPLPGRSFNRELPAKQAPSEIPKLPPNDRLRPVPGNRSTLPPKEVPRNAPGAPPSAHSAPKQPERTPPAQPPPQEREPREQ